MNFKRPFAYHQIIVLVLVLFSFGMAGLVSRTVFERLPHLEDEMAYLFQARTYARGNLVIESPAPSRAYWQPFVVDHDGRRFGKYTPGWPLQLMIGEMMGQAWVINAFLASMTVAVVYRLGHEIYNPETGLIAAALVAFSPMALLLNATLMGHTAALFAAVLFMYAYWRIERGKWVLLWGAVAGLALGVLIANRALTAVAVALPFVAWSALRLLRAVLYEARSSHPIPEFRDGENAASDFEVPLRANEVRGKQASLLGEGLRVRAEGRIRHFFVTLQPLIVLGVLALALALLVPIYNYQATGDPTENLYTLVWSYDRIGFGEGSGRPHTLEKAVRHTRFDLSLMAADLFGFGLVPPADGGNWRGAFEADPVGWLTGWRMNVFSPAVTEHLQLEADYYPMIGLSWVLLPLGLIVAFRWRAALIAVWLFALARWTMLPFEVGGGNLTRNPEFAWFWLGIAFAWLLLPLIFWRTTRERWTWLLVSVALSIIGVQMAYWIGSQRYSTRYYYEALASLALISALPLAWLVRRMNALTPRPSPSGRGGNTLGDEAASPRLRANVFAQRGDLGVRGIAVYVLIGAALVYSLYTYSTPRIQSLYRFNLMSPELIAAVEARREGDRPVLVLVNGENVRWRSFGPLMAVTSPYLDSDIVAAWNFRGSATDQIRQQILERFPDRQVIEMDALDNQAWFREETAAAP
jgi:hypothetical protein